MIDVVIDISHHQTKVDLAAFKSAGGMGVILKASQGSHFVDNFFVPRLMQAVKLDLLVGAYHFCDASSPVTQADLFVRIAGYVDNLRLFLDIEENGTLGGTVSVQQAAEIASRVETAIGRMPDTYTGRYQPDGIGGQWGPNGNSVLKRGALWISHYTNHPTPNPLPPGWKTWVLWQYTETGTVAGVAGLVDRNRFDGTEDELRAWWQNPVL